MRRFAMGRRCPRRRWRPKYFADRLRRLGRLSRPRCGGCARMPGQFLSISNGMPFLETRLFHLGHVRHPIAPYSFVDKPAVLVSAKIISDHASMKVLTPVNAIDVKSIFSGPQSEESFMKVVVTDERKRLIL